MGTTGGALKAQNVFKVASLLRKVRGSPVCTNAVPWTFLVVEGLLALLGPHPGIAAPALALTFLGRLRRTCQSTGREPRLDKLGEAGEPFRHHTRRLFFLSR